MNTKQAPDFYTVGGLCGIIGTISYIIAITFSFSPAVSFLFAMAWPVLSIIFAYAVYKYILLHKQSIMNELAFIFTCIAFVLVSIMISIQLAVKTGMEELMLSATGSEYEALLLISRSLRWVDLGIDLAWDIFIGLALILLSMVIKGHPKFGIGWSIPFALLGITVVATNVYTFPNPPDTQGLFDVGPLIGALIIVFGARMVYLGLQMKKSLKGQ
jgi:hypothetical protein